MYGNHKNLKKDSPFKQPVHPGPGGVRPGSGIGFGQALDIINTGFDIQDNITTSSYLDAALYNAQNRPGQTGSSNTGGGGTGGDGTSGNQYWNSLEEQYLNVPLINPYGNMQNEYSDLQNMFLDMPNFYDKLSNQYSDLANPYSDMTNQYANLTNPYAGATNQFADLSNPYADMTNQFASLENRFEGMQNQYTGMSNRYAGLENVMEDATINQQQADYQRDVFQQSQADTLGGLRGAAGGSGVAALAQQLAQSGQLASQQASASIGAQEAQNQRAKLAEAARLQGLEAAEGSRIDQLQRGEAGRIDQLTRQQAGALDLARAQGQTALDMASAGQLSANELARAQGQTALDMAMYGQDAANQLALAQGQTNIDMASANQIAANQLAEAQGQTALDIGWANQAQANELAAATGASNIDQLIAGEQSNINQLMASGDWALQSMEMDRLATALGMNQMQLAALLQQQQNLNASQAQNWQTAGNLVGDVFGSIDWSSLISGDNDAWLGDPDVIPGVDDYTSNWWQDWMEPWDGTNTLGDIDII